MLRRSHLPWLFLVAAFAIAGCRTTTESETREGKQEFRIPEAPPPEEPSECPVEEVVCSQEYSPALCSASSYDGRAVDVDSRVVAWGTNGCTGALGLRKQACKQGLKPSKLGQIQCVPDASDGNCPPESIACPPGNAPSVCTAKAYGDQELPDERALKAWGSNACVATANLAQVACRQNLNPKMLKQISCGDDPSAGECPIADVPCKEKPRPVRCTARKYEGKNVAEPLESRAESACEAKQDLARQACKRSLRPSSIDEIVCVFEK